jgi:hypothetical protein
MEPAQVEPVTEPARAGPVCAVAAVLVLLRFLVAGDGDGKGAAAAVGLGPRTAALAVVLGFGAGAEAGAGVGVGVGIGVGVGVGVGIGVGIGVGVGVGVGETEPRLVPVSWFCFDRTCLTDTLLFSLVHSSGICGDPPVGAMLAVSGLNEILQGLFDVVCDNLSFFFKKIKKNLKI